jgi:hypothetical protein
MATMKTIYNTIIECTASMRKRLGASADGLKYWTELKKILEQLKHLQALHFKKIPKSLYESTMLLPEKTIDGYGNIKMIEINHFLIQLVRIPTNEEPTFIKIIQLAYNWGQLYGSVEQIDSKYNKLSNINTFISVEEIRALDNEIKKYNIDISNLSDIITKIQKIFENNYSR